MKTFIALLIALALLVAGGIAGASLDEYAHTLTGVVGAIAGSTAGTDGR